MRTAVSRIVTVIVTLGVAAVGSAGALDMPPGTWWKNQQLVERIALSGEQQDRIAGLVYEHAQRMIDLHADVRHRELELRGLVAGVEIDTSAVRAAFSALQKARMSLERERFELLLQVRQALTSEQWMELQKMRRERQSEGRRPRARRAPREGGPDRQRPPLR